MTKKPHLKDRIRARMAETGESYMTARRHVIGAVPDVAPVSASRWRHLPGVHPQTTVARTLLAEAGVRGANGHELSEALVLGLSGGIRVNVYESRYDAEDFSSLYLTPRPLSDDLSFVAGPLERAGASAIVDEPGARAADAALRRALDAGPVAVWLDLAEAGYAGLPASFSGGAYHVVTVLDHSRATATPGDVAAHPIVIDATRLTAARARIRKYKSRTVRVDGTPAAVRYEALVRRALDASARGIASKEGKSGPVALDRLAAAMRDEDRTRAWSTRFPPGPNLARALAGFYRFIEVWGTGGGFLRPLFADFLDEAASVLGTDGLHDAAGRYRDAGREWTLLAEEATPDAIPPLAAFREAEAERADARAAGAIPPDQGAAFADAIVTTETEAAGWLAGHRATSADLVATLAQLTEEVAHAERTAEAALRDVTRRAAAGATR